MFVLTAGYLKPLLCPSTILFEMRGYKTHFPEIEYTLETPNVDHFLFLDLFPIPFPDKYFIYLSQECYFFKKHGHSKCSVGMGKVDSRILGPNMTTSCPSKQENIMQSFSWKISCRGTLSAWDIHWHLCHLGTT